MLGFGFRAWGARGFTALGCEELSFKIPGLLPKSVPKAQWLSIGSVGMQRARGGPLLLSWSTWGIGRIADTVSVLKGLGLLKV